MKTTQSTKKSFLLIDGLITDYLIVKEIWPTSANLKIEAI